MTSYAMLVFEVALHNIKTIVSFPIETHKQVPGKGSSQQTSKKSKADCTSMRLNFPFLVTVQSAYLFCCSSKVNSSPRDMPRDHKYALSNILHLGNISCYSRFFNKNPFETKICMKISFQLL